MAQLKVIYPPKPMSSGTRPPSNNFFEFVKMSKNFVAEKKKN